MKERKHVRTNSLIYTSSSNSSSIRSKIMGEIYPRRPSALPSPANFTLPRLPFPRWFFLGSLVAPGAMDVGFTVVSLLFTCGYWAWSMAVFERLGWSFCGGCG